MGWEIETRGKDAQSCHLKLHRTGHVVYEAALMAGQGVRRTSFGGGSRAEIHPGSNPLEGAFRWGDEVRTPIVTVVWRDTPDGAQQKRSIILA